MLVLVVHRHDRHLHPCLLGVQENRERWNWCPLLSGGLCPKITSLPAQSPYILSRGAGLPPADPGTPSLQAVPALSPTASSRRSSPDRGRTSALPGDQGMVTRRVICPLLSQ